MIAALLFLMFLGAMLAGVPIAAALGLAGAAAIGDRADPLLPAGSLGADKAKSLNKGAWCAGADRRR